LSGNYLVENMKEAKMSKKFKSIYAEIERFCFDREDPALAIRNMRNFTEGYDAFGIEDEELKILRDRILTEYEITPREIAELGLILLQSGKYEFGTLAILLIKKHRPRMDAYVRERIKEWLDTAVENWAHADFIGSKILPIFFELELIDLESYASWRDSRSKYTRRAVVTSLMWQRRALDAAAMLLFLTPLIRDQEKVVQQALGTFLADLWEKAQIPVEAFLEEHKDSLDSNVLKQATEQMPISKAKLYRPKPPKKIHNPRPKPKFKPRPGGKKE
jgi:3-methyladenine DNA glycosylase AlkD